MTELTDSLPAEAEPNAARRTYNRTEYLPDRAKMMQHWAETLD